MTQEKTRSEDLLTRLDKAERDEMGWQNADPKPPASPMRRLLVWTPVFLAMVTLLGLLGWGLFRQQGGVSSFGTNDGPFTVETLQKPASDFAGALYDPFRGQSDVQLSDFRGEVVVVNFWASWCPPCRDEAPILEQTWRKYKEQGVVFLGVDIWDTEQDARAYMEEFGITFPNLIDERGRIAVEYGLTGVPETYFVTPDGMISRRVIGAINRTTLEQNIEEARTEGTPSAGASD
ncbi:MAG: TlpA family protein disulfide reductase [Caldilineaceae bacterium]|nr:TlpA family protein disulfide reductase [Caldilineaceae bacterium]